VSTNEYVTTERMTERYSYRYFRWGCTAYVSCVVWWCRWGLYHCVCTAFVKLRLPFSFKTTFKGLKQGWKNLGFLGKGVRFLGF